MYCNQPAKGAFFMANKTQMLKGILEGCVLRILSEEKLYSQEICERFENLGVGGISRGTILPLLLRMENEGWIAYEKCPIANGPSRKYYSATEKGIEELRSFEKEWKELYLMVNGILKGGEEDEK